MSGNDTISPPKKVHIYLTNNKEVNFDDIQDMTPVICISLNSKKMNNSKGQTVKLQERANVKFIKALKEVKYLVVYIETNQNNSEQTYINGIKIKSKAAVTTYAYDQQSYEIQQLYNELQIVTHKDIGSEFLLQMSETQTETETKTNDTCDINNCIKTLSNILKKYNTFISAEQCMGEFVSDDTFDITSVLNVFYHLLSEHSKQFEHIYNLLVLQCNDGMICEFENCIISQRQHRDRVFIIKNQNKLESLYNSKTANEIALQQILDKIHCHFFHTFDIGYKFTQEQKRKILDNIRENESKTQFGELCGQITRDMYDCDTNIKSDNSKSKFVSKIDNMYENQLLLYDYGYRYFYWSYYKDKNDEIDNVIQTKHQDSITPVNQGYKLKDWYIVSGYSNIKEELLQNNILRLGNCQFLAEFEKAQIYATSNYIRQLCSVGKFLSIYGIKPGSTLTTQHLVALQIYCNYTELSYKFSETYRKFKNESDYSLKKRHSNYANMGRLLREFVDCFGTDMRVHNMWTRRVYHGMSIEPQFATVRARIKGPLSTTTDYAVALNFGAVNGVILELGFRYDWSFGNENSWNIASNKIKRVAWINCVYVSDFSNEQEIFFIGGYDIFYFNTIILKSNNHDYRHYINAIKCIAKALSDVAVFSKADAYTQTVKLAYILLLNRLYKSVDIPIKDKIKLPKIPKYVEILFDSHCRNVTFISFAQNVFVSIGIENGLDLQNTLGKMIHKMFFEKSGMLKWNVLSIIFPALRKLCLQKNSGNRKTVINESFVTATYDFLKNHKTIVLEEIVVMVIDAKNQNEKNDKKIQDGINKITVTFSQSFRYIGWKLQRGMDDTNTCVGVVLKKIPKIATFVSK
eukprot:343920_1